MKKSLDFASLRVQFILASLEIGGAERQSFLLARYLKQQLGVDIHIRSFAPGPLLDAYKAIGIPWTSIPRPDLSIHRRLQSLSIFAIRLRQTRPNVLMSYLPFPNIITGLTWRWTGAMTSIWNQRDAGIGLKKNNIEKKAVKRTPWFLSNAHHSAHFLMEEFSVSSDRVAVIKNGVEIRQPATPHNNWRKQLNLPADCLLVCMVANLSHNKDHETLLYAWSIVREQLSCERKEAVLLLPGRFDTSCHFLKSIAYDLELGRSVRFLNQIPNVDSLLSEVDIGVFSSYNEGCPNGLLECMAHALPVVATDCPGNKEALGEGGHSFLAVPKNAEHLAEKILILARDEKLRKEAGAVNKLRIKNEFNPERMCEETAQFIERAINNSF